MFSLSANFWFKYFTPLWILAHAPQIRVRRSPQGPPPPLPIAKAQKAGRIRKQPLKPAFNQDDAFQAPYIQERADLPVAGSSYEPKGYKSKGKVGPVYTFVKTDYDANFKWGVRHVAGQKYAGRR